MNQATNETGQLEVILVETQPDAISAVNMMFSEIKECRLEVLHRYSEVLDRVSDRTPDLVLLSHGLPDGNCLDVVNQIAQKSPSTYVIVFLPQSEETLVGEYIKCGANGFAYSDKNFLSGILNAVKKALIRIVQQKSFLISSVSGTSFFPPNDDSFDLLNLSTLAVDEIVLHYRILEEIGEGGMGQIYRSEDLRLGRQVAIKVLPPRVTKNEKARLRLIREARLASSLNHPNIVTIYSIEETEKLSFIAMEYVPGESLWKILQNGPMELLKVLDIGIQVADALNAAHVAGLVHRDIKPANVMISPRGQVKLLDFGLAKPFLPSDDKNFQFTKDLSAVGVPVGTVSYMSPEQTRGEDVDSRSDIWSLGSVLYQAATGSLPFQGPSALSVMHDIATAELIPPSKVRPDIPLEFDHIMKKAMAKDRQDRFPSVSEFSDRLRRLKGSIDKDLSDPALQAALIRSLIEPPSGPVPKLPHRVLDSTPKIKLGRVFLVEDNEENRDMLSRRLQKRGFDVSSATNAEEGIKKIIEEQPDLVLMDISLPLMNGFEASGHLKTNPFSRNIPIIALTAHAMPDDKQNALNAGCDDYDTKPIDFERLMAKIHHWLDKKSSK
ncbi:response regulator [bacterium]|nr:response regulator [bacterium]